MPSRPFPSARAVLGGAAVLAGTLGAVAARIRWSMGASRRRLRRVADGSPHARDGIFADPGTAGPRTVGARTILRMVLRTVPHRRVAPGVPPAPVPLAAVTVPGRAAPLAATWLGHACVLLEVDGCRVLVDPVWSTRASPVPLFGPRRLHPPPAPLSAVSRGLDVVLLTHDHYDHLDVRTVRALARDGDAVFVAPLGVGEHLAAWGVPRRRIVQRDRHAGVDAGGLRLTCLPARHFSGRGLRRNTTQWAAWSIAGPRHRVYAGGDTGASAGFVRSGTDHGPFDLTVLPIGAYAEAWPQVHMTPEQAVDAHLALRGDVLLPIHWATFDLGFHAWAEPVERLHRAAADAGVRIALPRPGERFVPDGTLPTRRWWPHED